MSNGVMVVELNRGYTALIDYDDLDAIKDFDWRVVTEGGRRYAVADSDQGRIYMHKVVVDADSDVLIRHIGTNTLDNRKENLRIVEVERHQELKTKILNTIMLSPTPPTERDVCRKLRIKVATLREVVQELHETHGVELRRVSARRSRNVLVISPGDKTRPLGTDRGGCL